MNRHPGWTALALWMATMVVAEASAATPADDAATDPADLPYELGVIMSGGIDGYQLSESEFARLSAGLADGYHRRADKGLAMTYDPQLQALRAARAKVMTEHEKQAGLAFATAVAAAPGARKTASGLVYISLSAGKGATPTPRDAVRISYQGKLVDGSLFDSSIAHHQATTVVLGSSMPCFKEGIPMMRVGGKSRLVCQSDIAYGDRGSSPTVRPGATVEYDIELLEILPASPRQ